MLTYPVTYEAYKETVLETVLSWIGTQSACDVEITQIERYYALLKSNMLRPYMPSANQISKSILGFVRSSFTTSHQHHIIDYCPS